MQDFLKEIENQIFLFLFFFIFSNTPRKSIIEGRLEDITKNKPITPFEKFKNKK
jgi:hypothetical protein